MLDLQSPNKDFWPCIKEKQVIGKVTSAVYSPRLKENIAMAMIDINFSELRETLEVKINNCIFTATIVKIPFYDPQKKILRA